MSNRLILILVLFSSISVFSQSDDPCGAPLLNVNSSCTFATFTTSGSTETFGAPLPGCGSFLGGDVWFTLVVPANGNVQIDSDDIDFTDSGMAAYSGTCSSLTLIECDDDGSNNGAMSFLDLSGLTPGETIWIRFWEYGNDVSGDFQICANEFVLAPPATNSTCDVSEPICSGSTISFQTAVTGQNASVLNPGNNYDCLGSSPDPTWYYLEIDSGGDLIIDMSAANDIDFAIWGPFDSLQMAIDSCDNYGLPIDCSYSTSPVEQANVLGTVSGEVYVLVVTNYAGSVQNISISDAVTSSATTDCSIVPLSVDYGSFEVYGEDGYNRIVWSTLFEENSDYFILEKSTDTKVWEYVAIEKAGGNSTEIINYSAIDDNPNRNGFDYYRLKQFDLDGSVELSDIVFINNIEEMEFSLFPNPAENQVKVSSQSKFNQFELIDLSGKIVQSNMIVPTNSLLIDLSELINGVYFVKVSDLNGNSQMKKLIVQ